MNKHYMLGCLFLILLFILTLRLKETFETREYIYEFLDKNEASVILTNMNYFNHFNKYDYKLRQCSRINVSEVYNKGIRTINKRDKQSITWLLNHLIPKIKKCYHFIPYKHWRFIKVENLEYNMPHTRKDVIVLPTHFYNKLNGYKNTKDINTAISDCGLTLIHEQIHIFQRTHPELFIDLYKNYWHFNNTQTIHNLEMLDRNRTNPDGLDIKWIFNNNKAHLLPVAIYEEGATNLSDVDYVLLDIHKLYNGYNLSDRFYKITGNNSFTIFFGKSNGYYHPNEISAMFFEKYFKKYHNIGNNFNNSIAYKRFKKWLKKYNN